jgi:hypothetical protein
VRRAALAIAAGAVWLLYGAGATAADHANLEDNQPVTVTDAYATGYLNRELQGIARYQRTGEGDDVFVFQPRYEVGFPRNAQLAVGMPMVVKGGQGTYAGRANAEVLYNLNVETLVVPALAVVGAVELPSGRDLDGNKAEGTDPSIRGYLTKSLPGMRYWNRVHLNFSYQFNDARQNKERAGRYVLAAGYSFRLSTSAIAIADLVREQRMQEGKTESLAELGVRYQVTPLLVVAVGGGVGFGKDSPAGRATLSAQWRAF